ncbi:hypothetical protein ACTNEO_15660 [Gracilibacillus sp. HCP3S3_G5_1]|uniref:hypothetical protein n=1 Tax=unclassified Gracilibacillus TaxID=2625209 RepID=UPI003F8AB4F5
MSDSIQKVFQFCYKLFLISFYYWLYLLKGLIIYSFIPATASLLKTCEQFLIKDNPEDIRLLFKENYQRYHSYYFASFLSVMFVILSYTALFFVNRSDHSFSLAMIIVIIYFMVLFVINFTFGLYYLTKGKKEWRNLLAFAFVSSIKYPLRSLYILFIVAVLYVLLTWNLVAFVALAPCIYGCGITTSFIKFSPPFLEK